MTDLALVSFEDEGRSISRAHVIGYAIDLYLDELASRGCTLATITKYREVLYPFCDQCNADRKLLHEITTEDCRRYLSRWAGSSPNTRYLNDNILRGLFRFYVEQELLEPPSPMDKIKRPYRKRPEDLDVTTTSSAEVDRMFGACEDWQELLCLATLAYLGPRRSAAAGARRRDVDLERGTVRFREKGGKVIVKPLPDQYVAILRAADQQGVWSSPLDYLIPNRGPVRRKDRSGKIIWATVKRIANRAGVDTHPHALRAAFAVRYLEDHPGDLDALQHLLGHERTDTTRIYLRRQDRFQAMSRVRDLKWGSVFPSLPDVPPTGFEPAFQETSLDERLRSEAAESKERSGEREPT